MSKVLVGVDTSEVTARAVELASDYAKAHQVGVIVVHVIPWSPFSFNTPEENEDRSQNKPLEIEAATTQIAEPQVKAIADKGVPVEMVVRHGDPVDTIVDIAEEHDVSQIFIGRTGDSQSRVRRALFGTIPGHLVQTAPVPVTVVP